MPLDPNIPLSAGSMAPSLAKGVGQAYELAGAMEKQQQMQEQRQDQQAIQQYLKEGGNFNTPDGLTAAAEKLKGVVSPKAYQTLTQAKSDLETNQAKQQEYYAKMGPQVIENQMQQQDFIAQSLETPINAYKQALAEKKDPQEALRAFESARQQVNQQIENMPQVGGRPVVDPQMRQKYMGMNPAEAESALKGTRYHQEQMKAAADLQYRQAQIETQKAEAEKYRAIAKGGPGGGSLVGVITGGGNAGVKQQGVAIEATQEAHPWLTKEEVGQKYQQARGLRSSINQQRNAMGKLEGFERTALANIDLMAKEVKDIRSKQAVDFPLANKFLSFVKEQAGIPYDQAFGMYGREVAAELTKLASSATASGTGGTLTDREEWNKFFQKGGSFDQIEKSLDAARKSASARIRSSHEAIQLNEDEMARLWEEPGKETHLKEIPQSELRKPGITDAAPAGAIEKLKQNPHLKDQFKAKYGYLPEGM